MSKRPSWRQLTLFDDQEIPIPVSVESPAPSITTVDQMDRVPSIDVTRVRRRRPPNQPELEGLR